MAPTAKLKRAANRRTRFEIEATMGVGQAYPVSAGYRKRVQAGEKPSKFNNLLGLV